MRGKMTLPNGCNIDCIYLSRSVTSPIGWLHAVRRPAHSPDPTQKKMYEFHEQSFLDMFANEVINSGEHFEVAAAAPSSHPFSERYKDVVLSNLSCIDISDRFNRIGESAASTVSSFDEFSGEFEYQPSSDENNFNSVLIIDDVLGRGNTALHIIQLLTKFGVPDHAKFLLAAPLWPR